MWTAISDAFTNFITMVGELVTALTGTSGALAPLLPLFAIGIAISIFMVGFKAICCILPLFLVAFKRIEFGEHLKTSLCPWQYRAKPSRGNV